MSPRPTGTVTFLFTDIEGSTSLLQDVGDAVYSRVLADHRRLIRAAADRWGGYEVETQGDGFLFAFQAARDAVLAAIDAQRSIAAHAWPVHTAPRVRMGLHTGEPIADSGGYVGLDIHRTARICQAGWGGQILLSESTCRLVEPALPPPVGLRDLGAHRLKALHRPEHVFQLIHPDLPVEFPPLRSLDSLPNNLPVQLTSFIGRDRELAEVARTLTAARLVTLTGSGGCGKTRLALAVAAAAADAYRDGVWFADLAPLTHPALVPQALASTLRLREQPGRPLSATLVEHLTLRDVLLVLDNCEHVIAACAEITEHLLRACPRLKILATSRERIGVAGEVVYRVPSLSLPDPDTAAERLTDFDAVRLFVERATAVLPGFRVTSANAALLVQICRRLDGIPLALELAAARVKVLPLAEIAQRLDDRFRLLLDGVRTLPRHQTLKAAMDWSYALLSDQEKVLLDRLSVFAGGWTLEAAETVCAGEGVDPREVLDLLARMVDKSLVIVERRDEHLRYRVLETVRHYAGQRLTESGQADVVRRRHRDWYLNLAEEAEAGLRGSDQSEWLDRLDAEHDNIRAALQWSRARHDRAPLALRLAAAMGRFWWMRGYFTEGRAWLEGALGNDAEAPARVRARAALEAGRLAWAQGDMAAAQSLCERSLGLFREIGERSGVADALNMLGLVLWIRSDYAAARARYEEGLALAREIGEQRRIAVLLNNLGLVAAAQGHYETARALHEESLEIATTLQDTHFVSYALNNLGLVAASVGNHDTARQHYEASLTIRRERGDKLGVASTVSNLGLLAARAGRLEDAEALCQEGLELAGELGDRQGIAQALSTLCRVAQTRGDLERAARLCRESLTLRTTLGDRRGIIECLERLALLAVETAAFERAAVLLGAAGALRKAIGTPVPPVDEPDYERTMASAGSVLGPHLAGFVQAGAALTLEQAVDYALEEVAFSDLAPAYQGSGRQGAPPH